MELTGNLKNRWIIVSLHSVQIPPSRLKCYCMLSAVQGIHPEIQCRPLSLGVFSILCNLLNCGFPTEHRRLRSKWMCIVSGTLCAYRIPIEKIKGRRMFNLIQAIWDLVIPPVPLYNIWSCPFSSRAAINCALSSLGECLVLQNLLGSAWARALHPGSSKTSA